MKLILAIDVAGGIAKDGKIPWKIPEEMQFFKEMTWGKTVVMGRLTHESIGHDLKGRVNLVVTKGNYQEIMRKVADLESEGQEVWCIGGRQLAIECIDDNRITEVYLSVINQYYGCDLSGPFKVLIDDLGKPQILPHGLWSSLRWHVSVYKVGSGFTVYRGQPPNREERKFQQLIRDICRNGDFRQDRTGTGTCSLFGEQLKFKLYRGTQTVLPMSTIRKSFNRGIFEELMWFIRGQTDSKILEEKKVNIWKDNSKKEVLENLGLAEYPEGDCGPVYGFQWRHWGSEYPRQGHDNNHSHSQEYDQLASLIETIRTSPMSRRMVLSAWNVADLDKMVLPPCHVLYQFEVSANGNRLSCHMYQRSSDIILAGMWNVTSAALLTILLAKVTGKQPGELTVSYGNVHIYNNHPQAKIDELLQRGPYPFPTLTVADRKEITDFVWEDLKIEDYQSHEPIEFEMNV